MPIARNLRLLGWFNFLSDFRPYAPIAILYFSQVAGSYALGMSVFSVAMLSQSVFEVPTGVFSDLIGRKKTVLCGAAASTLALIFYAVGGSYVTLLVGAIFEGLARAFYSGNNNALLHNTLTELGQPEAYQEYLGKTSSMFELALGISAVIGSLLAAVSFSLVMWVSVIPLALALFVSLGFIEPRVATHTTPNIHAHLREAFQNIARNPRLRLLSAATVLIFAISESAWLFRAAFVEKLWPVWALGISQMMANAGAAIGFYFAGRIIRRFGEFRLLMSGISLSETVNLAALLFPSVLSPVLLASSGIFFGVNTVAIDGLLQREFNDQQRATMGSINSFAGSIVFAVFSFLLGALADRVGVILALVIAGVLSIIPMLLYAWALGGARHAQPTSQEVISS